MKLLEMLKNFTLDKELNKADLHTHTVYSDGRLKPSELLDLQLKAGNDVLAVTDHDTIGGAVEEIGRAHV